MPGLLVCVSSPGALTADPTVYSGQVGVRVQKALEAAPVLGSQESAEETEIVDCGATGSGTNRQPTKEHFLVFAYFFF